VGDKELKWGLAFLRETAKGKKLPLVCANLLDKKTKTPALPPYFIKKVGTVTVGVFGVMSDKVDLGPSRDSLVVQDPADVARKIIPELRKKGCTVVVLLSQLGKVESEDLVTAVDGIDAVMIGRNVPLLQKGRLIKNTVACYGGEQGQYIGRTVLALDAQKKVASGDNETFILGPEVGEKPEVLQIVKAFEDSFNEKQRKLDQEKQAQNAVKSADDNPQHFIGTELCARCHQAQAEQWKTTKHSHAWETLVNAKKDATPECVPCHTVGYKQAGGFFSSSVTPKMVNVGCENCHGMGTEHDAWPQTHPTMAEATCTKCHSGENDPAWSFSEKLPKVIH
jgi:2',3'-cyclic-nucleotide 2'-phosphodiesterase (5'-nucleotidase family)